MGIKVLTILTWTTLRSFDEVLSCPVVVPCTVAQPPVFALRPPKGGLATPIMGTKFPLLSSGTKTVFIGVSSSGGLATPIIGSGGCLTLLHVPS